MAARTLSLNKRGFNFETFMWAFTRFTVIAMYGLIIAGILVALIISAQSGANFGNILIITMPSRMVWPFILVFCIWSLFWLTMESTLVATIFTSHNPNPFNVITFIIFFAIWNLLGLFLVYNILWQLIGKEEIQITKQSIKISQIVLMYKRSREYLFEHIKDLDLARVSISDLSFQREQFP